MRALAALRNFQHWRGVNLTRHRPNAPKGDAKSMWINQ